MIWINAIQESMIIIIENFVGQQNTHTHKMNDLENHLKNHITTHGHCIENVNQCSFMMMCCSVILYRNELSFIFRRGSIVL